MTQNKRGCTLCAPSYPRLFISLKSPLSVACAHLLVCSDLFGRVAAAPTLPAFQTTAASSHRRTVPQLGQCSQAAPVAMAPDVGNDQKTSPSDPLRDMGLPSPLILGSGSFTRKLILKEMGVPFHLVVRPIDERSLGDRNGDPRTLVSTLAKAKGDHLVSAIMNQSRNEEGFKEDLVVLPKRLLALSSEDGKTSKAGEWIVLTADQVVTHAGSILEKPDSVEEAEDFVSRYAWSAPSTVGACVLTHIPTLTQVSGVDSARIRFRPSVADANLVGKLLKDGAPVMSCAGGLMVEHPLVREHIEGIDGTEDSVMGLSKDLVLRLLRDMKNKLSHQAGS